MKNFLPAIAILKNFNSKIPRKFLFVLVILLGLAIILVAGSKYMIAARKNDNNTKTVSLNGQTKQAVNKEFAFELSGEKADKKKIKYAIESASLEKEIVIKGQKAKAIEGRVFLILNIKIRNDHKEGLILNSRDYVRLSVNNNKELLAPDIHNDSVVVQAISTKYTRLGFPINESDINLALQVGEIDGKKETIKLNL